MPQTFVGAFAPWVSAQYPLIHHTHDRVWATDVTYIWTSEGWLFLAVVLDLFARRVVGWAMADHLRTELALDALTMALGRRRPPPTR